MTKEKHRNYLIKSLVGSQAHGLASLDSDYDWRGVYVQPTEEILSLNHKYEGTHWFEGKEDNTAYEIGHFLQLCTKANPSVLEVLVAETKSVSVLFGIELTELFPHMFDAEDAWNAFAGYSKNQQKKMYGRRL